MQLSAEELRRLLDYDPETGVFRWRVTNSNRAQKGCVAGSPHIQGYVTVGVHGRLHLAHRLAWLYVHGEWPLNDVDHVNGDKTDNRLANLRLATRAQNMGNTGLQSNNTSGVKGVSWNRRDRNWQAYIKMNGKKKHLGYFASIEDAASARKHAAENYFGEFART